jgi:hypothetical protein
VAYFNVEVSFEFPENLWSAPNVTSCTYTNRNLMFTLGFHAEGIIEGCHRDDIYQGNIQGLRGHVKSHGWKVIVCGLEILKDGDQRSFFLGMLLYDGFEFCLIMKHDDLQNLLEIKEQ